MIYSTENKLINPIRYIENMGNVLSDELQINRNVLNNIAFGTVLGLGTGIFMRRFILLDPKRKIKL